MKTRLGSQALTLLAICSAPQLGAVDLPPGFAAPVVGASGEWREIVGLAFTPDGRLLVAEKRGVVHVVENGVRLPAPFLDMEAEVLGDEDRGLLGIAVDPGFSLNGHVYLLYSVDPDGDGLDVRTPSFGRLTRYSADRWNPNVADPSSRRVLLGHGFGDGIPSIFHSHTIGCLRFGEDGSLLVSTGDGAHSDGVDAGGRDRAAFGPGGFPTEEDIGAFRSQWIGSLAGKILRLDPETGEGLPTNPYFTGAGSDNASRVWAYGLRNPYRFCVRPGTGSPSRLTGTPGTLFVADVGWTTWEELNVVERGANLGWPCFEGLDPSDAYTAALPAHNGCTTLGTQENPAHAAPPLVAWHHTKPSVSQPPGLSGKCIAAVAFYTGREYPEEYRGACFIGEYDGNWIKVVDLDSSGALIRVRNFASDVFGPVDIVPHPVSGDLHYVSILRNAIHRIRYDPWNSPPSAVASSSPSPASGPAPLRAVFSGQGSSDPDEDPLIFAWDFGDGAVSTEPGPSHEYSTPGAYTATLTVSDGRGGLGSSSIAVTVTGSESVNEPPAAAIAAPLHGNLYHPDAILHLQGSARDGEDPLEALEFEWELILHHNTHIHPGWRRLSGSAASLVPRNHDDGTGTSFEIILRVKDTGGLVGTDRVLVYPSGCAALLDAGGPGTYSTGTWRGSTAPFPHGSGSLQSNVPGSTFAYDFDLPLPGRYNVYAWWTVISNRTTQAAYTIEHARGSTTVPVDQRDEGAQDIWNDLGTFEFSGAGRVTITADGSGFTCADAICIFPEQGGARLFQRGDTDANGRVDVTDPVRLLHYLFIQGDALPCAKAADSDDDGGLGMGDAIHVLNYLFLSGPPPAEPLDCGADPSTDELTCDSRGEC